jgi:hypothetical protein
MEPVESLQLISKKKTDQEKSITQKNQPSITQQAINHRKGE